MKRKKSHGRAIRVFPPHFYLFSIEIEIPHDDALTTYTSLQQPRRHSSQMEADIKLCEELLAMDSFNVKGEVFRSSFYQPPIRR